MLSSVLDTNIICMLLRGNMFGNAIGLFLLMLKSTTATNENATTSAAISSINLLFLDFIGLIIKTYKSNKKTLFRKDLFALERKKSFCGI